MPEPTDYSVAATPAREDIANALTMLRGIRDGFLTGENPSPTMVQFYGALAHDCAPIERLLTRALATLEHR